MSRAPEGPLPADRFEEILADRAPVFGLSLEPGRRLLLATYLAELDHWRKTTNLTGRLPAEGLVDHALEALVATPLLGDRETVADIGSGAGLPGLPLAIVLPAVRMTLIEPRGKRAAFLRHVVRALELPNVEVEQARIENVGGQTFDAATTRAVGGFSAWIGEAAFLRDRGRLLAWTTDSASVGRELGHRFRHTKDLPIPGSRAGRVAVFEKLP